MSVAVTHAAPSRCDPAPRLFRVLEGGPGVTKSRFRIAHVAGPIGELPIDAPGQLDVAVLQRQLEAPLQIAPGLW